VSCPPEGQCILSSILPPLSRYPNTIAAAKNLLCRVARAPVSQTSKRGRCTLPACAVLSVDRLHRGTSLRWPGPESCFQQAPRGGAESDFARRSDIYVPCCNEFDAMPAAGRLIRITVDVKRLPLRTYCALRHFSPWALLFFSLITMQGGSALVAPTSPPLIFVMPPSTLRDNLAAGILRARSATPSPPSA
jgi:hypothetical protein